MLTQKQISEILPGYSLKSGSDGATYIHGPAGDVAARISPANGTIFIRPAHEIIAKAMQSVGQKVDIEKPEEKQTATGAKAIGHGFAGSIVQGLSHDWGNHGTLSASWNHTDKTVTIKCSRRDLAQRLYHRFLNDRRAEFGGKLGKFLEVTIPMDCLTLFESLIFDQ